MRHREAFLFSLVIPVHCWFPPFPVSLLVINSRLFPVSPKDRKDTRMVNDFTRFVSFDRFDIPGLFLVILVIPVFLPVLSLFLNI